MGCGHCRRDGEAPRYGRRRSGKGTCRYKLCATTRRNETWFPSGFPSGSGWGAPGARGQLGVPSGVAIGGVGARLPPVIRSTNSNSRQQPARAECADSVVFQRPTPPLHCRVQPNCMYTQHLIQYMYREDTQLSATHEASQWQDIKTSPGFRAAVPPCASCAWGPPAAHAFFSTRPVFSSPPDQCAGMLVGLDPTRSPKPEPGPRRWQGVGAWGPGRAATPREGPHVFQLPSHGRAGLDPLVTALLRSRRHCACREHHRRGSLRADLRVGEV